MFRTIINLKVIVLVGIIFFSGCFNPPITGLKTYPKILYKDHGTVIGNSSSLGCYFLLQTALTKNNNFLLDFRRDFRYDKCVVAGNRVISLETVPKDSIIKVYGIKNTYINYPFNWFSILIKPSAQKIIMTMNGIDGKFQKISFL